ncbi:hypothetical protein Hanom_Chr15g01358301 [Helianthus anomalus]
MRSQSSSTSTLSCNVKTGGGSELERFGVVELMTGMVEVDGRSGGSRRWSRTAASGLFAGGEGGREDGLWW